MHWKKDLKKGQAFLEGQELQKALNCFESAVTNCPVSSGNGLEKILYYLGITLKKLGRTESALRCWHIARKVKNDGLSATMILKNSNKYGLPRMSSNQEEDKAAFMGIQLQKYLKMKRVNRFCSEAEKDVIKEIIVNHWLNMLTTGEFNHFSTDRKLNFFKNQMIIFPVSDVSSLEMDSEIIYTDFNEGKAISMNDYCSCGSGYLLSQCCGRIKSSDELDFGEF